MTSGERWEERFAGYAHAVRAYHARRGRSADEPAVAATIRTNTELVPKRGDVLLRMVADLSDLQDLSGLRALELGCGFGALAAYLAWKGQPERLVAVDVREDLLEAARHASPPELDARLEFVQADMRDLRELGNERFDLVILNNAFIYLPTAREMEIAICAIRGVIRPEGWVLFYHANRWRPREPFTGAPAIHLLPPGVARPVSRLTGWTHNHGRVRLVSPLELAWRLRRAGFRETRVMGFGRDRRATGIKRYFAPFYGLAARRTG